MTFFDKSDKTKTKEFFITIDTHAHLTDAAFEGEIEDVLFRSREQGTSKIITSGYNLSSSIDACLLAERESGVYASVGVYPENIYELNDEVEQEIFNLAKKEKVVAIGEIGLQYTPSCPDKERQKEGLIRQLYLAKELGRPIVIHCRDAYGDMLEILKKNKNLLGAGGTLHCYSGSYEMAKEFIKLGLNISVGGVSTFKNATALQETIKKLPLDCFLLETDCPYLAPHPFRGQRNDPSFIRIIAQSLANLKNVSLEEIETVTTINARRIFNI